MFGNFKFANLARSKDRKGEIGRAVSIKMLTF